MEPCCGWDATYSITLYKKYVNIVILYTPLSFTSLLILITVSLILTYRSIVVSYYFVEISIFIFHYSFKVKDMLQIMGLHRYINIIGIVTFLSSILTHLSYIQITPPFPTFMPLIVFSTEKLLICSLLGFAVFLISTG